MTWLKNMLRRPGDGAAETGEASPAPIQSEPAAGSAEAICATSERDKAQEWLAALDGDAALGEIALRARLSDIRLAAARRIADSAVLERVAEGSRHKDKGVYRHCHDLLRERREAGKRERRATELSDALAALCERAPIALSRLLDLEHELQALVVAAAANPGAEMPFDESNPRFVECQSRLEAARQQLQAESVARREIQALGAAAGALLDDIGAAGWPDDAQYDEWQRRLAPLVAARDAVPAWLASLGSGRAFADSVAAAIERLEALARDREWRSACESFLEALEASAGNTATIAEADIARWEALDKPTQPVAREALAARWAALTAERSAAAPPAAVSPEEAEAAPVTPATRPEASDESATARGPRPDREAVRRLVDALEQAIAAGHVADADTASREIAGLLGGHPAPGALDPRLQRARARLSELHRWAKWGSDQARDHLITAAEALLAAPPDLERLAREVPALREEWKRLNAQGPARRGQWERFDATLEKAFAPVVAMRAEEARKQAGIRAAKDAICAEADAFVAAIAWEAADYRQLEDWRQKTVNRWRGAGLASFRDERQLRKRFDAILAAVDGRLDAARKAEAERRQALVDAAGQLGGGSDLRQAINEVKRLQEAWQKSTANVRLERRLEQKLWQRFRAGCDAVFARRDEERNRQAAERDERRQQKKAALDAFASALDAAAAASDLGAARQALDAFRKSAVFGSGDRESDGEIDARVRELELQARRLIDTLNENRHRAQYDIMARKAAIAARLEAALLAADSGQEDRDALVAAASAEWNAAPPLPARLEAVLARRLATAGEVDGARLAAGLARRAAMLLDLEIELGIPSPDTCADERRRRQFERLQRRFAATAEAAPAAIERIAEWHAIPADADPEHDRRLATIVRRLAQDAAEAARSRAGTPPPSGSARRGGR